MYVAPRFTNLAKNSRSFSTNQQRRPNRLQFSKSPYLQQHKYNPVDWYQWDTEAFQKAKKQNRPIFLSIGYSTCHWCHVMEKESFEDEDVAFILNQEFVPIKVDREERPDVDRIYMRFVQATTGHGGWPMSVWLTPDLKPFYGGTYFPKVERYGQPAFTGILEKISNIWRTEKDRCVFSAQDITHKLKQGFETSKGSSEDPTEIESSFSSAVLTKYFESLVASFDSVDGGFGNAPKFPRPVIFTALFHCYLNDHVEAQIMIESTLTQIANGGIHDHIGGGFHRYSVDPTWLVPHFEKMLYDQAQLAMSYLSAYQLSKNEKFSETAHDIFQYVQKKLLSPLGGFYSAEDADSFSPQDDKSMEGAYYVWDKDEFTSLLDPEARQIVCDYFGVEEGGNVKPKFDPHSELRGKNILTTRKDIQEVATKHKKTVEEVKEMIAKAIETINKAREERPHPFLDDKIITSWNGLMISAFARGSQILQTPQYLELAKNAATFIRNELFKDGKLIRSFKDSPSNVPGFTDDYAFLIYGLLDLYQASGDHQWLKWAIELQATQDSLFYDTASGGYFSSELNQRDLIMRLKDEYDGSEPSSISISTSNLIKLFHITSKEEYQEKAKQTLKHYKKGLFEMPGVFPHLVSALEAFVDPDTPQVILAGDRTDPQFQSMLYSVYSVFSPKLTLLHCDGKEGQAYLRSLGPKFISEGDMRKDGKATAMVCKHFRCSSPTNDSQEALQILTE